MRYPRNAKIFRGQLDIAPLVSVLFLLVLFILLGSLIYTPGIPFNLDAKAKPIGIDRKVLTITKKSEVIFNGRTNQLNELEALREEFKQLPPHTIVVVKIENAQTREMIMLVREQARDLPIRLELPNTAIELPTSEKFNELSGAPNPTVLVAVNLAGQLFFQNQVVSEATLRTNLAVLKAKTPVPLTLVVMADKGVEYDVLLKLADLAWDVGISEMHQVVAAQKKNASTPAKN